MEQVNTISTETALRLVADPQRRAILARLVEREEAAVSLDELVEHVASHPPP